MARVRHGRGARAPRVRVAGCRCLSLSLQRGAIRCQPPGGLSREVGRARGPRTVSRGPRRAPSRARARSAQRRLHNHAGVRSSRDLAVGQPWPGSLAPPITSRRDTRPALAANRAMIPAVSLSNAHSRGAPSAECPCRTRSRPWQLPRHGIRGRVMHSSETTLRCDASLLDHTPRCSPSSPRLCLSFCRSRSVCSTEGRCLGRSRPVPSLAPQWTRARLRRYFPQGLVHRWRTCIRRRRHRSS